MIRITFETLFLSKMRIMTLESSDESSVFSEEFIIRFTSSADSSILYRKVDQAWKDKHVRALVSLSGVWAGTMRSLKVFAIGDDLGHWMFIDSKSVRKQGSRGQTEIVYGSVSVFLFSPVLVFRPILTELYCQK